MSSKPLLDRVSAAFAQHCGRAPELVWVAPGRVNLIGEHLDYNGGHVLPFAIDRATAVAIGKRSDGELRIWSAQMGGPLHLALADLRRTAPPAVSGWSAYVFGVVWAFAAHTVELPGMDIVIDSDVPAGSGLSSSAALECALAGALNDLSGAGLDLPTLVRIGQRAEHDVVGAPVGIMDQTASLAGAADHAVFLDCQTGTFETLPLPLGERWRLLVAETPTHHDLADGGYQARRRSCERAARLLGVPQLADAELSQLAALEEEPDTLRRARHVVTEEARTLETARRLAAGDLGEVGPLLNQSQASMRDDFEISTPELDRLTERAVSLGALGARLTGAGFGGAAIILVDTEAFAEVRAGLEDLGEPGGLLEEVRAGAGAHRAE